MAGGEERRDDPLHPRHSTRLCGHEAAEATLREAVSQGRLHHAWLITGPRGVGKATLAYRFARFLLARGEAEPNVASLFGDDTIGAAERFDMTPDHPVFQRVAAGSEGNLFVLERGVDPRRGNLRGEIVIDDVRALGRFFAHTAAEAGWRVAIVDSADEMNRSAANALLKILEEPPESGILLLVAHAPGRLLPTIRSRCRHLLLRPVSDAVVNEVLAASRPELSDAERGTLSTLAQGAPGRAIRLAEEGGLAVYRSLLDILETMPGLDRAAAHRLASELSGKAAQERYRIFRELFLDLLAHMLRSAATDAPDPDPRLVQLRQRLMGALSLDRWVELWEKMGHLIDRADAVHLDRKQVILSLLTETDRAARGRLSA